MQEIKQDIIHYSWNNIRNSNQLMLETEIGKIVPEGENHAQ